MIKLCAFGPGRYIGATPLAQPAFMIRHPPATTGVLLTTGGAVVMRANAKERTGMCA